MSTNRSRILRTVLVSCTLALLVAPATALADGGGANFTIGPIQARHGWKVTISASCSGSGNSALVEYVKGTAVVSITHGYSGPRTGCALSRSLASGKLALSWPGLATVDVKLAKAGA